MDNNIRNRVYTLLTKNEELGSQRRTTSVTIERIENDLKSLEKQRVQTDEIWATLRDLLDKFSEQSIGILRDLLNKGLSAIFTDRKYTVKVEITSTANKKLKLILVEELPEGGVTETILSGSGSSLLLNGGGIIVAASFIFQVFLILMYEKRRFILIDEGFTNISTKYLDKWFGFLKYLHTEMGFDFLLINQDPRFAEFMDSSYRMNMGVATKV